MPETDVDLDAWIDGTTGLTKTARIYQRGDLFATLDTLERELAVAKKIKPADRGVNDPTPESLQGRIDATVEALNESSMLVHVQDRTDERRRGIVEGLKKKGLREDNPADLETMNLRILADAIVKIETPNGVKDLPDGFPPEKLRAIRDRLGDAGLFDCFRAYNEVTGEAPEVAAPLSQTSSSGRSGSTSSSSSAQRKAGASPRSRSSAKGKASGPEQTGS